MDPNFNPYQPPMAADAAPPAKVEVPAVIIRRIKHAWVAALLTAGVTAMYTVSGTLPGGNWLWIDIVAILGAALGIYYGRSRVCAVSMFCYFIVSKLTMLSMMNATAWLVAAVFAYFYYDGVRGTFAYHKFIREAARRRQAGDSAAAAEI